MYILVGIIIFVFSPLLVTLIFNENPKEAISNLEKSKLEQWKQIKFEDKPNIYLISFDAMIPNEISGKYMGIQKLPYASVIKNNMLRKIPSFSPRVATLRSLNSVMNLDDVSFPVVNRFFAGIMPSILTSIISSNNYDMVTGFSTHYFGTKGRYINEFKTVTVPRLKNSMLCLDVKTSFFMQIRLFGICNIIGNYSNIGSLFSKNYNSNMYSKWIKKVINTFQESSIKIKPQFSFIYVFKPVEHTAPNYRYFDLKHRKSYRSYFLSSAKKLNRILHRIIDVVKIQDPKSIVVVFGDHGAYLSRGLDHKKNHKFILLDRHTIELAVLKTEHPCVSDEKIFHYSPNFATPSRVLAAIFRCLAKEPKEVDKLVNFVDSEELNDIYREQFPASIHMQLKKLIN